MSCRRAWLMVLVGVLLMASSCTGLLSGIAYQESSKKLGYEDPALRNHATIHLALVHGHMLLVGTFLPLALAGMMFLARKVGGKELGPKSIRCLTWGYLPSAAGTVALMLYKGYHFLLAVRAGERSVTQIDASYFGGATMVRHSVYGLFHTVMGIALIVFLIAVWRSLRPAR